MQTLSAGLYKSPTWQWIFAPLALIFWLVVIIRRCLFNLGVLPVYKSSLPVIVVGNISVGGNGKTPIVLALVEYFLSKGLTPAVLSRGYGGQISKFPFQVGCDDAAYDVGDEPALVRQRYNIPVVIDPDRVRGVQYIEQYVEASVVICDDGMQHYALARDVEICIMDKRGLGNGYMLPLGPLRETSSRLASVDMVMVNGNVRPECLASLNNDIVDFALKPSKFINVLTGETLDINDGKVQFNQQQITAIAGIGNPQRFFDTLDDLNINIDECLSFADHYKFSRADVPREHTVIMTEKDAVKCRQFAEENCWYLQVHADLPPSFYEFIAAKLTLQKENQPNGF